VFEFIRDLFPPLTVNERQDVAFLLHQLDSGLAPAVHRSRFIGPGSTSGTFVSTYLIPQAQQRNCDIAVIGTVFIGGLQRNLRWFWDRTAVGAPFACEDTTVANQNLGFFTTQASAGTGRNVFVGLPVGMGRRWGVDFDDDTIFNLKEAGLGTNPLNADTDGDGFFDDTEVGFGSNPLDATSLPNDNVPPIVRSVRLIYKNARIAKLIVETNEAARVIVNYTDGIAPPHVTATTEFKRLHTVLLRDLEPSYTTTALVRTYTGTVSAVDKAGNPSALPHKLMPSFSTESFITAFEGATPRENIISSLSSPTSVPLGGGGFRVTCTATVVDFKQIPPAPLINHAVVGRVILNGSVTANFVANGGPPPMFMGFAGLLGLGGIYNYPATPYLIGTVTGASGVSTLQFDLPTAVTGDQVQISIETAGEIDPATHNPVTTPSFLGTSRFEFPGTLVGNRATAVITL
jgi:hypothetical protein